MGRHLFLLPLLALAISCGQPSQRVREPRPTVPTVPPRTDIVYPTVIIGRDGWLYLGEDLARACRPTHGIVDTLARLRRLDRMVTESGRRLVLVVAPDKSSVIPEHLPEAYSTDGCALRHRRDFWERFDADPPVAVYVDLDARFARLRSDAVYRKLDSHWTPQGAAIYAQELATALDPRLWEGTRVVRTGTRELGGDLAQLLGRRTTEAVAEWEVVRPGVHGNFGNVALGAEPASILNRSTGVALFPQRTLLLVDSFSLKQVSGTAVFSLFEGAVALYSQAARPQTIAREIAEAEVVVVEAAERYVVSGESSLLADETLVAIEAALRS